jgi:GMP synthase-like glutamine amidotransferase
MRRWIALQHVSWEGPARIAAEARARGLSLEIRRIGARDAIPEPDEVEGLIVMGGPMGVYEADRYPFLLDETRLIAELVKRGQPVLGVCLGAQLLASALGARVYKGPAQEIGFGTVSPTADARQDPIFAALEDPLPVFHWHGDTFDLPKDAVLLARNASYEHQAFRFGRNAYGLQFHVEVDLNTWNRWKLHLPEHATSGVGGRLAPVENAGAQLFARFFDIAQDGHLSAARSM